MKPEASPDVVDVLPNNEGIDPSFIKEVYKRGDVLDTLRKPLQHVPMHYAIRAGALTTGFATGLLGGTSLVEGQHLAYGAAAAGAASLHHKVKNYSRRKKIDAQLARTAELRETADEPLELIRSNHLRRSKRGVQLYWGAELDPDDKPGEIRTRLESITELAEKAGLDTIVVPAKILSFVDEPVGEELEGKATDISDWLEKTKRGLPIVQFNDDDLEKEVMSLSPDECRELAQHIEQSDEDRGLNPFVYAWGKLREARPTHALFSHAPQFDTLADTSRRNGAHSHARHTLANHMARGLDDTAVQRGPNHQRIPVSLRGSISAANPRVRLQGTGTVETHMGTEAVHAEDNGDLLKHLNLEPIDIRLFFENPGRLSEKKRIQAAEVVLLYELSGWELPYNPEARDDDQGNRQNPKSDTELEVGLQHAISLKAPVVSRKMRQRLSEKDSNAVESTSLRRLMPVRVGRIAIALTLAIALSRDSTSDIVNTPINYMYHQQKAAYIDSLSSRDPEELLEILSEDRYTDISEEELQQMIAEAQESGEIPYGLFEDFDYASDPYSDVVNGAYRFDGEVKRLTSRVSGQPGGGEDFDRSGEVARDSQQARENAQQIEQQSRASVGNVDPSGGNKPLWKLTKQDMSTAGYWTQATHTQLYEGEAGGLYWSDTHDITQIATETIPTVTPEEVETEAQWIHVRSVMPLQKDGWYTYSDDPLMPIPVLDGTVPAAVSVSTGVWGSNETRTAPGGVVQRENGTFMAVLARDGLDFMGQKFYLDYWLVPASSRPDTPFGAPRAREPINGGSIADRGDFGLAKAHETIDKYVEGLPSDGLERTEALEEYISENFSYALQPFPEKAEGDTPIDEIESMSDYVDLVLGPDGTDEGNCNTVNTVLGIDNPEELSAVTGYRNSPDADAPYDTLSIGDAHLWMVDGEGAKHDATPTSGISEEDAAFFDENFTPEDFRPLKSTADEWKRRMETAKTVGIIGASGIIAAYAIRKRKRLAEVVRDSKQKAYDRRARSAHKQVDTIVQNKEDEVHSALNILFGNTPSYRQPEPITSQYLRNTLRLNRVASHERKPLKASISKIKAARRSGDLQTANRRQIKLAKRLLRLDHRIGRSSDA